MKRVITINKILATGSVKQPALAAEKHRARDSQEATFSKALADSLEQELQEQVLRAVSSSTTLSDGLSGSTMAQSGSMELLLMNAAQTGNMSDAETALFMMCMMMQSMSDDSQMSSMMAMMSPLLSNIMENSSENRRSSPDILNSLGASTFEYTVLPQLSTTGGAILPEDAWKPISPAVVSTPNNRSPEKLRQVIDQFSVETSHRYQPYRRGNDTYCNIFLWDVTTALNCEIPHFIDPVTGGPRQYPDLKGAVELGAVQTEDWLVQHGPSYGWWETDARTAQEYANQGKPSVTSAGSIGHVQVVCPSTGGNYDPIRGVAIAQAGSRNTSYTHISSIYSGSQMSKVRYFVHE